jgi:hypothetical protein
VLSSVLRTSARLFDTTLGHAGLVAGSVLSSAQGDPSPMCASLFHRLALIQAGPATGGPSAAIQNEIWRTAFMKSRLEGNMPRSCFLVYAIIVVVAVALAASPAFGQAESGTISGTVRDSTGAVIPGATVTIKNAGTSMPRTTQTGSLGQSNSHLWSERAEQYQSKFFAPE